MAVGIVKQENKSKCLKYNKEKMFSANTALKSHISSIKTLAGHRCSLAASGVVTGAILGRAISINVTNAYAL